MEGTLTTTGAITLKNILSVGERTTLADELSVGAATYLQTSLSVGTTTRLVGAATLDAVSYTHLTLPTKRIE